MNRHFFSQNSKSIIPLFYIWRYRFGFLTEERNGAVKKSYASNAVTPRQAGTTSRSIPASPTPCIHPSTNQLYQWVTLTGRLNQSQFPMVVLLEIGKRSLKDSNFKCNAWKIDFLKILFQFVITVV